jgi:hypothetical protein
MINMPLHPKYAKTCTIKLYIIITIVMKWICISVSILIAFCVAKHELTSPADDQYYNRYKSLEVDTFVFCTFFTL